MKPDVAYSTYVVYPSTRRGVVNGHYGNLNRGGLSL